jgi:hypothetical protein
LLRSAERLYVPVQDLVGRRSATTLPDNFNFIRIVVRRRAVLLRQARRNLGVIDAAMARIASYHARSAKVGLIDGFHHHNHPARCLL